ncbi:MAG: hypothetical protein HQ594_05715 [Candidatus Omnitrophica bacterium]|nr:hypothetical protein [Candidatus Omnitrophota bacterium]
MKGKLKEALRKKLAKDILVFFYENPFSIDSVGGISAWVNGDRKEVQLALDELVDLGVLERDSMGTTKGFSYTRDEKVMRIVKDLVVKG